LPRIEFKRVKNKNIQIFLFYAKIKTPKIKNEFIEKKSEK